MGARLEGLGVVVMGAAGGIGSAVSRAVVGVGGRVALVDRDEVGVRSLATDLASRGFDVCSFVCDATVEAEVDAVFTEIENRWGGVDGLVHVAGGSGRASGDGPADRCTLAGWETVLNGNLTSVFLSNRAALRIMLRQAKGVIVNTSSVLGMIGGGDDFATHAYAAAKGAIISFTRAEAVHYAAQRIRVNCVAPGLIRTAMSRRAQADRDIVATMKRRQPVIGDLGEPEDVAAGVLYLLSDEARMVTGIVLPIDGGWTAQ